MRRFEIYWCQFDNKGYNIQGTHPALITTSNALTSNNCPVVTVIPITSTIKDNICTHIVIEDFEKCGLNNKSCALVEQITTIGKENILDKIGYIYDKGIREKINRIIAIALGVSN